MRAETSATASVFEDDVVEDLAGGSAETDDPVEQEIDVYITNSLTPWLSLVQFPLRPQSRHNSYGSAPAASSDSRSGSGLKWGCEDGGRILDVQYKAEFRKLELTLEPPKGRYQDDTSVWVEHKPLLTSTAVPLVTNYAIGILRKGATSAGIATNDMLHLTPLDAILQMRPSMAHIDREDAEREKDKIPTGEPEEEETKDAQPVTVIKRKGKQNERQLALQELKREDSVKAAILTMFDQTAAENTPIFERLVCTTTTQIPWNITKIQYLDFMASLPPLDDYIVAERKLLAKKMLSLRDLRVMSPVFQLATLLNTGGIVKFATVKELCTAYRNETQLFKILKQVACLMHGCWTLKSTTVCKTPSYILLRDYILLRLLKDKCIVISEIVSALQVPEQLRDTLKSIVSHMCVLQKGGIWNLKTEDPVFAALHPELVSEYQIYWSELEHNLEAKTQCLTQYFMEEEATTERERPTTELVGIRSTQPSSLGDVQLYLSPADSKILEPYRPALTEFLTELFGAHGVCNMTFIKSQLKRAVSDNTRGNKLFGFKMSEEMLRAVLRSLCINIHSCYVLAHVSDPAIEQYRSIVLQMFKQAPTLKKPDVRTAITSHCGPINNPLLLCVMESLSFSKGGTWCFKPGEPQTQPRAHLQPQPRAPGVPPQPGMPPPALPPQQQQPQQTHPTPPPPTQPPRRP
ncbi:RNA polymerase III subunit [Pelomyxa schiedti]|nr:RNA polymerase III subunit [Pelomyxa schiedti]